MKQKNITVVNVGVPDVGRLAQGGRAHGRARDGRPVGGEVAKRADCRRRGR